MSRKKKTDGVQDALIPDEITPLMLLALTAKASRMKDAAAAFRIAASKMLDLATKDEYIEKYKNIDPITDALYDACDLSQHIFDAANAVNDLINYPVEARERVVKADIERSLLDPWRDLPTSGGDVDPDTGGLRRAEPWQNASTDASNWSMSVSAGAGSACRTCPYTRIYRSRSSDPIQWLSASSIST